MMYKYTYEKPGISVMRKEDSLILQLFSCINLSVFYSTERASTPYSGARFDRKVGQICPKWDKNGTFSYKISLHAGFARQCDPLLGQT